MYFLCYNNWTIFLEFCDLLILQSLKFLKGHTYFIKIKNFFLPFYRNFISNFIISYNPDEIL